MTRIAVEKLTALIVRKLVLAGLSAEHAGMVAASLVHADARGVHSHGVLRVEYYAERISKGGTNLAPRFVVERRAPAAAVFDGDNGAGHVAAFEAIEVAIEIAREQGVAAVGVRRIGHSGALSFFVEQAARQGLVALSMCQSDPMAVPYGGAEPYYGTNPIAFAAPGEGDDRMMLDMATTVQAWGKVLNARMRGEAIPPDWAVDASGAPTTDADAVRALLPIAGPKGYGLMMMVDVLAGMLLGLPFGKHVSSMYHDLSAGRELGQLHLVIDPAAFTDACAFRSRVSQAMRELSASTPAAGVERVLYPGEDCVLRERESKRLGVEVDDAVLAYLESEVIHRNAYAGKDPFAR